MASMSVASNAAATDNEDAEEDFIDAKTSVDAQRRSVYRDANETTARNSKDVTSTAEGEEDGSDSGSDTNRVRDKGKGKIEEGDEDSDFKFGRW